MEKLLLDFGGQLVRVIADAEFLSLLKHDFACFIMPDHGQAAAVEVTLSFTRPDFSRLPELRSTHINERCVVYKSGHTRWQVYYNNEALSVWDTLTERAVFYSLDRKLLHELVYLFILSRTGELLDRQGFHRIHASAVSRDGQAVVFSMPSGGGKTTLAMAGLQVPGWQFMSDDSPYVTRSGNIRAFPSRLGLRHLPENVSDELVSRFKRREFNDKYLVNADLFRERIATEARPFVFLVGCRKLSGDPAVFPISKFSAFVTAFKTLVVGLGLPQLIEYFLRLDIADIAAKVRLVVSRTIACYSLIRRSRTYGIALGPDIRANVAMYQSFLKSLDVASNQGLSLARSTEA